MDDKLLLRIENKYGRVPWDWADQIDTRDSAIPCLRLPSTRIKFGREFGFWPHVKVLRDSSNAPWIALQLASFELSEGPGRDWAIPLAYTARNEEEALRKVLGFDEGWDESVWETTLLFDSEWWDFFAAVASAEVLAVTVQGADSAYPLRFFPHQLELFKPAQTA